MQRNKKEKYNIRNGGQLNLKKASSKYVYKIESSRLRNNDWNLELTPDEARTNGEVIKLLDSQALRFINQIRNNFYSEYDVKSLTFEKKKLKKEKTSKGNIARIKEINKKLDKILFMQDYICIVMDNNKDFDRAEKGFKFNKMNFFKLYATSGGGKKGIIVYVSERVYKEMVIKLENGRDLNAKLVPAKYEAYISLVSSASTALPWTDRVIVIKDYKHKIYKDVYFIKDGADNKEPIIEEIDNMELEVNINDGYGFISYPLAVEWSKHLELDYVPSGFCVRFGTTKGMLFVFDYHLFGEKVAGINMIPDAWGNESKDVRNYDIILTTSMAKLWSSYSNLDSFMQCNKDNGYTFSVTKPTPKKLENERNLTYQFIQSLPLSDEDIEELIKPTLNDVREIKGGDWRKSLLFLKGTHLTDKGTDDLSYDYAQALMINPSMIDDPFVKSNIKKMIKKRIDDAKLGKLKVNSNYSIISGDPYALAQSMFQMKVTGLLGENEFYSRYWLDRNVKKVACFRAPMTCHNNIRILRFKEITKTEDEIDWYKHMNTVTILNIWDTTTHALNGADMDSDAIMTSNSDALIRNITELKAIVCDQKKASDKIITKEDLIKANKASKGDDIGAITNRATGMYDLLSMFDPISEEYKTLHERIMKCQKLQQDSIDKTKGIKTDGMPSYYYSYNANVIKDKETKEIIGKDEFNLSILADKKPYFMIYRYPELKQQYESYIKSTTKNCMDRFGISLTELMIKEDKTDIESDFMEYYYKRMPVTMGNSTMNRICRKVEEDFKETRSKSKPFDYSILKSNVEYDENTYEKVNKVYEEYKYAVQSYEMILRNDSSDEENKIDQRGLLKEMFTNLALEQCSNENELCNIVVDMCYKPRGKRKKQKYEISKQFAWDISGETIINNLLELSGGYMSYPEQDDNGDIEFSGERFAMVKKLYIKKEK